LPEICTFDLLRKFVAILFLSVFLFTNTELRQLLKFPVLVEHYFEHKEKNGHLTIWQFLHMHYASGDTPDADYDKDMKLPFKSHADCAHNTFSVCLPQQHFSIQVRPPVFFEGGQFFPANELFLPSAHLAAIWQPPRYC